MAIDTIKSSAVLDGAIATADIADDAVTNAKIGANAVGTTEVADDAITGAKIENNPTIAGNLAVSGATTIAGLTTLNGKFLIDGSNNDLMTFRATGDTSSQVLGLQFQNNSEAVTAQIFGTGDNSSNGVFRIKGIGNVDIIGGDIGVTGAAADLRVHTGGVVSIPSGVELGSGVDATASNILDDYEEGSWTPICGTGGVNGSYSVQLGRYIKVGNLVQCIFNLTTSGSYTGNTSHVFRLGGLPFANKYYNGSLYAGGNIGYYFNINTNDAVKQMVYQIPSGSDTSFELKGTADNSGEISIIVSNFNSNSVIRGQLVYHTA